MKGKSVVITGGSGFLGSNLASRLVNMGANVTLIVSPNRDRQNITSIEDKVEIIPMRVCESSDFGSLIKGKDYFFHFAWQNDLKKSMENPIQDIKYDLGGLINLLENCRKQKSGLKIIFPSTVTVTGDVKSIPSNGDERANPPSIYDANKLAAENYLKVYSRNYGVNFSCLRLANVFGEGQSIDNPNRGVVNFMIGRALRGEGINLYGDGELVRDYSYVQNFVDAFILAAESKKTNGEIYVLGSGEGRTFNQVASTISKAITEVTGIGVKVNYMPFPEETNQINKRNFIADSSRFRTSTGWQPRVGFEEGIRRTIDFYKHG